MVNFKLLENFVEILFGQPTLYYSPLSLLEHSWDVFYSFYVFSKTPRRRMTRQDEAWPAARISLFACMAACSSPAHRTMRAAATCDRHGIHDVLYVLHQYTLDP